MQLPPPPPPPPWLKTHALSDLPRWRQPKLGWITLNVAIGIAVAFGLLLIQWGVLIAAGRDTNAALDQRGQNAVGGWELLLIASSLVGWLLFAYLRRPAKVRGTLLALILWAGWVASTVGLMATFPKFP